MFDFTPGPWVADEYPHGDCWQIKYGTHGNWLAEVMIDGDHKGAAADARLIAAAPDLLSSLIEVVAIADRKTDAFDRARAAILKATSTEQGERG